MMRGDQEMRDKFSKAAITFYMIGAALAVWLGLLIAPYTMEGLPKLLNGFSEAMRRPFHFVWTEKSLQTMMVFLMIYLIGLAVFLTSMRNYRRGEEHGSAKWGQAETVNRTYADKNRYRNKILTQHVSMGYDSHKHRRNLNTIIVGGSGSGKTRYFVKPNLLNAGCVNDPEDPNSTSGVSYFVLDPKGELISSMGNYLEMCGYHVLVLDLVQMGKSLSYNPFAYLKSDNDIQRLVTNLFKNTTPKGSSTSDPFWDQAAMMLLLALMFYLHYEAPPEEQNFSMVLEMIRAGEVKEEDDSFQSTLDILFNRLEMRNPEHVALKYYRNYRSGSGKTLKSIQITLLSRLEKFNLEPLAGITQTDELELNLMGERKTALFAVIPDNDSSFNFLIGMLYTQLFQQLYYQADFVHDGKLPYHVHLCMDEFANIAVPDDFDKLVATMRSREISVSIILQNLAQLKAMFEKQWESVCGNCDTFLYLGGNEQSTHEYVSKLLGKETIDTNTYGQSKGRSGSYSTNYQNQGRDLLDPSEIRLLNNRDALLFIRGERPVKDQKYDLLKHPNIIYTTDGGAEPYRYGEDLHSIADITVNLDEISKSDDTSVSTDDFLFFTDEELKELLKKKEDELLRRKQGEKIATS